jgi:hypothetical protein
MNYIVNAATPTRARKLCIEIEIGFLVIETAYL